MQHSVLGERFVYDATTDPVAVGCFVRALRGQQQAALEVHDSNGDVLGRREPNVKLGVSTGHSGDSPIGCVTITLDHHVRLRIARVVGADRPGGESRLTATWSDEVVEIAGLS